MNIVKCARRLAPLLRKSSALLEQTSASGRVCSARACTSVKASPCRANRHAHRFYSQVCGADGDAAHLQKNTEDSTQGTHRETDADRRPGLPEKFDLDILVSLLRQENGVDICVIKVPEHFNYADYFIVVSGMSVRHLRAMAFYIIKMYKFLKKANEPNVRLEGKDAEDWMCVDFGNMVVHFMLPETREVYELEKLWTLRSYDEQLMNMPTETLPEDFIYDADITK